MQLHHLSVLHTVNLLLYWLSLTSWRLSIIINTENVDSLCFNCLTDQFYCDIHYFAIHFNNTTLFWEASFQVALKTKIKPFQRSHSCNFNFIPWEWEIGCCRQLTTTNHLWKFTNHICPFKMLTTLWSTKI